MENPVCIEKFYCVCILISETTPTDPTTVTTPTTPTTQTTEIPHTTPVDHLDLQHAGEDCWRGCNKVEGKCDWCGSDGWCCRQEYKSYRIDEGVSFTKNIIRHYPNIRSSANV